MLPRERLGRDRAHFVVGARPKWSAVGRQLATGLRPRGWLDHPHRIEDAQGICCNCILLLLERWPSVKGGHGGVMQWTSRANGGMNSSSRLCPRRPFDAHPSLKSVYPSPGHLGSTLRRIRRSKTVVWSLAMSDWEDRGGGGRGGRGGGRGRGRGRGGGGDRDDSSGAGGGQGGASAGRGGSRAKIGGLTYTPAKTPSFLKAFQAQLAGAPPPGSKDPYSASDGRAALPGREGRQTSEEREEQERLEGDEFGWGEGGDDAPQVVVLKEGKHLTLEEMEDERRKGAFAVLSALLLQSNG